MCEAGDRENRGAIIHRVKFAFFRFFRLATHLYTDKQRRMNIKDENNTAEIAIY